MQPINFFLGLRAIWMTPHCFDCACQHLFGAPLHYHSVSVLIPHDQSTCSEVSFLIILPFFLMEQANKIRKKPLLTVKYNSSFYHCGQSA